MRAKGHSPRPHFNTDPNTNGTLRNEVGEVKKQLDILEVKLDRILRKLNLTLI